MRRKDENADSDNVQTTSDAPAKTRAKFIDRFGSGVGRAISATLDLLTTKAFAYSSNID